MELFSSHPSVYLSSAAVETMLCSRSLRRLRVCGFKSRANRSERQVFLSGHVQLLQILCTKLLGIPEHPAIPVYSKLECEEEQESGHLALLGSSSSLCKGTLYFCSTGEGFGSELMSFLIPDHFGF